MKKLYTVRLYREMLLQFNDIPAESPQLAAQACEDRSCDDAFAAPNDCGGDTFVAEVDLQYDPDYSHSVTVEFEAHRDRKVVRAAVLLLDMIRSGALSLGDGDAEFQGVVYAFDQQAPDWKALVEAIGWDKAREAVREATAASLPETPSELRGGE